MADNNRPTLFKSLRRVMTAQGIPSTSRDDQLAHFAKQTISQEQFERIRYPGEVKAAKRIESLEGFRTKLREIRADLAMHPTEQWHRTESVRLEAASTPRLFDALRDVAGYLGVADTLEVYQNNGPLNVSVGAATNGAVLTLSGPVLELFDKLELRGVLGHELAHYILHSGPTARCRDEKMVARVWSGHQREGDDDTKRLAACALSIASEVTADRIELLVSRNLDVYITASLKFATELGDAVLRHDPQAFLRQVREILSEGTGRIDRRATHPDLYLRIRAAELFWESDLFQTLTGIGPGNRTIESVNEEIDRLLVGWTPSRKLSIEPVTFEQFLLAAGTAIARADGEFQPEEREYMALTLPIAWNGRALSVKKSDALIERVAKKIRAQRDRRAQLVTLNFLCGLVDADGRVKPEELAAIDLVGRSLGAQQVFRRELRRRYEFDPEQYTPEYHTHTVQDAIIAECPPALLRFLDTVILAKERTTTAQKLIDLGRYTLSPSKALYAISVLLNASGIKAVPPLDDTQLTRPTKLVLEEHA